MSQHKFLFYPSLLDGFQSYLNSDVTYEKYWGGSENPSKTFEEFDAECLQKLIDNINRVPIPYEDTEAIDNGVCFDEIVNCLVANKKSDKVELESGRATGIVTAKYNGRIFTYPLPICLEFSRMFYGSISQVYCEGTLPTKYGDVLLYGYIDMLLCDKVHDIKTTSGYEAWKYRNNWQHRVYPYCLDLSGNEISAFEYNILEIKNSKYSTYKEYYNYDKRRTKDELTAICEQFIEFIEAHKNLITDLKIFNFNK